METKCTIIMNRRRSNAVLASFTSATPRVHSDSDSIATLMPNLATLALQQVALPSEHTTAMTVSTKPSLLQHPTFDLIGVEPNQTVPITVTD